MPHSPEECEALTGLLAVAGGTQYVEEVDTMASKGDSCVTDEAMTLLAIGAEMEQGAETKQLAETKFTKIRILGNRSRAFQTLAPGSSDLGANSIMSKVDASSGFLPRRVDQRIQPLVRASLFSPTQTRRILTGGKFSFPARPAPADRKRPSPCAHSEAPATWSSDMPLELYGSVLKENQDTNNKRQMVIPGKLSLVNGVSQPLKPLGTHSPGLKMRKEDEFFKADGDDILPRHALAICRVHRLLLGI